MLAGDAVSVFGVNVLREHGFLSSGAFEDAHFAEVAGGVLRGEKEDVLAVGAFRVTLSFESRRAQFARRTLAECGPVAIGRDLLARRQRYLLCGDSICGLGCNARAE